MATKIVKKTAPKKVSKGEFKKTVLKRKTTAVKKKVIERLPSSYVETASGLVIPRNIEKPVPASKLQAGFNKAKKEINSLIKEVASTMVDSYSISEIELTASFSADGKFMGFGVGGVASIKIKIKPEGH